MCPRGPALSLSFTLPQLYGDAASPLFLHICTKSPAKKLGAAWGHSAVMHSAVVHGAVTLILFLR